MRILLISGFLSLMVWFVFEHLVIVTSNSIDHRAFWKTDQTPKKGDYVLFDLRHELVGLDAVRLTKRIACGPGELLEKKDHQFLCDGTLLGHAKLANKLPAFKFEGVIPENEGFVMGTHEDSFDSRYFGLVDLSKAIVLKVIF
ncbi:MAG: S26 family signal peptidase [Gammaproteobacteria bacterium]